MSYASSQGRNDSDRDHQGAVVPTPTIAGNKKCNTNKVELECDLKVGMDLALAAVGYENGFEEFLRMYNMWNKSIKSLFFVVFFLATGCVNSELVTNPAQVDMNAIQNNSKYGYAAFSAICIAQREWGSVDMLYEAKKVTLAGIAEEFNLFASPQLVSISCKNAQIPQYFLLRLRKGAYKIYGSRLEEYSAEHFKEIPFEVLPGKITYFGRIIILIMPRNEQDSFGCRYKVINAANTDMPWFYQHYSSIPKKSFFYKIAKIKN